MPPNDNIIPPDTSVHFSQVYFDARSFPDPRVAALSPGNPGGKTPPAVASATVRALWSSRYAGQGLAFIDQHAYAKGGVTILEPRIRVLRGATRNEILRMAMQVAEEWYALVAKTIAQAGQVQASQQAGPQPQHGPAPSGRKATG